MAVIGSIRKRSTLLILIIGGALFAFIIGEFLNSSMSGPIGGTTSPGEVAGAEIGREEFSSKYSEIRLMYDYYQPDNSLSEEDYKRYAWSELVREKVFFPEISRSGIKVTQTELDEMMYGDDALQEFKDNPQFLTNGVFDGEMVRNYYDQIFGQIGDRNEQHSKILYKREINRIVNQRKEEKYQNMIKKGLFATSVEGRNEYDANNAAMDLSFVYKRYSTIADSTINVSDSDIQSYFNAHKEESRYQQQEARTIKYVSFSSKATQADIDSSAVLFAESKASKLGRDKDTSFVRSNNSTGSYIQYYNSNATDRYVPKGLGDDVVSFIENAEEGEVSPVFKNSAETYLSMYKVKERIEMPDSAKASHILIAFAGAERAAASVTRNPLQAQALADSLLDLVKASPSRFEELATEYSDGPSATKAGDLGWFVPGVMAPAFNDYCFQNKKGDIDLVITSFGFHIIDIKDQASTSVPTTRFVQIDKEIKPSKETRTAAYNRASRFRFDVKDQGIDAFEAKAEEENITVETASRLSTRTRTLPNIGESERVVTWSYRADSEQGSISEPFEVDNQYLVAILTEKIHKGDPVLEYLKEDMKAKVLAEKKAAIIQDEWAGFSSLEDIAELTGGNVQKGNSVNFSKSAIAGMDPEPSVIGSLAGAEEGSIFFIDGDNGVAAVRIDAITGLSTGDEVFVTQQNTLKSSFDNKINTGLASALNKLFDVNDNLHEF
ncbi:MAG: peptidylprolyl isomerase [Bacteroidota bacterium]